MCANFKPLTYSQLQALNLPPIPFEYLDEVYPVIRHHYYLNLNWV
jgi:hypothetical protein